MDRTLMILAVNACLSGHLAVASLLVLNLTAGSTIGALMAPLCWALVQMAEWASMRDAPRLRGALVIGVYASQLAAAVLALVA